MRQPATIPIRTGPCSRSALTTGSKPPEKRNPEDPKDHGEPQRNRRFCFRLLLFYSPGNPSVFSVALLCVLCVKFRKAPPKASETARAVGPFLLAIFEVTDCFVLEIFPAGD